MTEEASFLRTLNDRPDDAFARLVFADFLEERGDPRGELLRLTHTLTESIDIPDRSELEERLRFLRNEGVQPIGPFWRNTLGMKFVWIPPGKFMMGSPREEEARYAWETQHKVTVTKGFYMGVHPVTQEQWRVVMSEDSSSVKGKKNNRPFEEALWDDCQEFIRRIREREKKLYRLPTEAEWEYACRGGTSTAFFFGETISTDQANYNGDFAYANGKKGTSREKASPVGSFSANSLGLFDMHGNAREWCHDRYGKYSSEDVIGPQGPNYGEIPSSARRQLD